MGNLHCTYLGSPQVFRVPFAGSITATLNGAGTGSGTRLALGGKTTLTFKVKAGDVLYIYAGGSPTNSAGGWNGGGTGGTSGLGGAGATDIRLNGTALANRICVAGGAGGTADPTGASGSIYKGGVGGGTTGGVGTGSVTSYNGGGGTQAAGGTKGASGSSGVQAGSLGQGGNGEAGTYSGGGGGGYYGGGGGGYFGGIGSGGGGSGFYALIVNGEATTGGTTAQGTGNASHGDATLVYTPSSGEVAFAYTGAAQTWTAQKDGLVTAILNGAGVDTAGGGTLVTFAVKKDDILQINIGGTSTGTAGGWNGGGTGATSPDGKTVKGGAGATDIRLNGTALTDRIAVAGGSGSSGSQNPGVALGGRGGGLSGENGINGSGSAGTGGAGGTQTTGYQSGIGSPTFGFQYNSHYGQYLCAGAGGGGYFGGQTGNVTSNDSQMATGGGGGGSGFIAALINGASAVDAVTAIGAGNIGNGDVALYFTPGGIISIAVAASTDDGDGRTIASTGPAPDFTTATGPILGQLSGSNYRGFALFKNIIIPSNATVKNAFVNLGATAANTLTTSVSAEASDNPAAPTTAADVLARALTAASVPWNIANTSQLVTPDISSVVQEVITRQGWVSGNAILVFFVGSGANYQQAPDKAGILTVQYTLPSGPTVTLWDGVNELTGTLNYWDGTTEVPITSAELAP